MSTSLSAFRNVALCAVSVGLAGCSLLNPPKGVTPRSFVLTPIPAGPPSARPESTNLIVGIKRVKMPEYLSEKSFAMRQGSGEIVYLESAEWAERLDAAFQRVLAANLGALIPTDQVRLTLWAPEAVAAEVEVNVERFDVDSRGEGVLIAWWRVVSPGSDKVLASGKFSSARKGRPPNTDPQGAASSMSGLAADLAGKLAQAIKRPGPEKDYVAEIENGKPDKADPSGEPGAAIQTNANTPPKP